MGAAPPAAKAPAVRAALDPVAVPALSLNEEMQIRPDLREALGKVAGITPQQRLDLLAAVRGTLSPVEANALFHELLEPRPPTVSEGWNSVYVQNLCLILREQPAVRETFARVLATLARDPARDAVVRDYAVQHLRQVWDRADEPATGQPAPPPAAAVLRASIERTFRDLAAGNEPAMAAAGLLSLHFLGTRQGDGALPAPGQRPALPPGLASVKPQPPHYALPDAELQPLAEKVLSAAPAAATVSLRMTAIRVIAERQLATAKPSLRAVIAAPATEHALTRMAAIGALGSFADPADRPLLENLDRRDVRIATAARTALASSSKLFPNHDLQVHAPPPVSPHRVAARRRSGCPRSDQSRPRCRLAHHQLPPASGWTQRQCLRSVAQSARAGHRPRPYRQHRADQAGDRHDPRLHRTG